MSTPRSLLSWKKHEEKATAALNAENIEFAREVWNAETANYKFCCTDEQYAWLQRVFNPYADYNETEQTVTLYVNAQYAKDQYGWPASGEWMTYVRNGTEMK